MHVIHIFGIALPLDVISQALQVLLEALLPVLAAMAAAWLKSMYDTERAKLSAGEQIILDNIVKVAVFAAEQLKLTDAIDSKLDYATNLVQAECDRLGLKIDASQIRALIEAAVREQFPPEGAPA